MKIKTIIPTILALLLPCLGFSQSAILTVNQSTGLVNVPGGITLTFPNGVSLGTPSVLVLTNATGLPISTGVSGLGSGVATFLSTPASANLLAALTTKTGTGSAVFGTSPTITTPIGILSTDIGYTRSGSGMLPRTTGAEIDELPVTSRDAGAVVNGSTDDTIAIQRQLDSKKRLRLSRGNIKITDDLSMSTIGQIVEGDGIGEGTGTYGTTVTQATSGKNGLKWLSTTDTQTGFGAGLYSAQIRNMAMIAGNSGTGTGFIMGGSSGTSYCTFADLYAYNWLVGVDFNGTGISRVSNLTVQGPGSGVSGSIGVKVHGTTPNSQLWSGLSVGNCETGFSDETGAGNVHFLGDFGSNDTHVNLAANASGTFIGGNFEDYGVAGRAFNFGSGAGGIVMGIALTLSGSVVNEPIYVADYTCRVTNIGPTGIVTANNTTTFKQDGGVISLFAGTGIDSTGITTNAATVTITNASPTVVSWTGHGLYAGMPVIFTTSGGLPAGLTVGTIYYVSTTSLASNSFKVSDTEAHGLAGSNMINTSSAGSGTQTGTAILRWKQQVFPIVYDGGGSATFANRGAIFQQIGRNWVAGVSDDIKLSRMSSSGAMVLDSLANGVLLENSNTWGNNNASTRQTFNASTGGYQSGITIQSYGSGSLTDTRGCLLLTGSTFDANPTTVSFGYHGASSDPLDVIGITFAGTATKLARFAADHVEIVAPLNIGTTHQGDILYDNGSYIVRLTPGTSGQFLQTNGPGANPAWANTAEATVSFKHFTDASTTHTDGTEDDLYTDTTVANTFLNNGDSVSEVEHVSFVSSATAARRLKKYFGGTLIFDSGSITLTLGGEFNIETTLVRESSTIVRASVAVTSTSASTIPYAAYTRVTGLTLSSTNILKTTGIASGTGAASGDIVNKLAVIKSP